MLQHLLQRLKSLRRFIFSTHGLSEMIVSDNGSVFTSKEFADFMTNNSITHVKPSPYHPSTNRLAERAVQTFKASIKKHTEGTLESKLSHFLFHYHLTPQTMTGQSPAKLLFGRRIKTCWDLLLLNVKTKVTQTLQTQKLNYDNLTKDRAFDVNDKVFVNNPKGTPTC